LIAIDTDTLLGFVHTAIVEHRIISDLWWFKDGINHYMSIKTVKPNIDQTAVAKQDLLGGSIYICGGKEDLIEGCPE